MSSQQEPNTLDRYTISKIFGKQKVKLYDIKHIIFDFGGVMVEKTFVLKNLFDIIEDDFKIKISREEPYVKKIRRHVRTGIISSREFLEKIFNKYYYPHLKEDGILPPKKANVEYYLELWFQLYSQLTHLSYEIEEIIARLHQAGFKVSLMSNTYDIHAKSNELKGFFNNFDQVFLSNEIGLLKPDLEKYKYVLQKLETKPKKCIFIDDKISNLVPAKHLGITVIKFESLENFKEQLNEMGIVDISKNLRLEIRKKYKQYKMKKKEFKKAKKEYKKAKKEFLEKKRISLKRKMEYERKRENYLKKKLEFKQERKKKKKELETKIKVS